MTLREKIGQCLLVGQQEIYGEVDADGTYFKRNTEDLIAIHEKEQFGVIYGGEVSAYKAKTGDKVNFSFGLADQHKKLIPSDDYKRFMEKQGSYLKYPPLVSGDFTNGLVAKARL